MNAHHRPTVREVQLAGEIDWQPTRRWPGWLRVGFIAITSAACWAAIIFAVLALRAVLGG